MKIGIEVIFKSDAGRIKSFTHVFIRKKENALNDVYQAVRQKMKEYNIKVEVVEVIAAGKDITDKILEIDKEYHKNEFYRLEDELPF